MLNVGRIEEGFVLDHIKAGKSMTIYHDLKLDKLDCCVAIIKNARSNKMGKKDIIKIDEKINIDFNVLGYIDHNITINIIENNKANRGGGIYVQGNSNVNIEQCEIKNNTSNRGGAIYNDGNIVMDDVEISGNVVNDKNGKINILEEKRLFRKIQKRQSSKIITCLYEKTDESR